MSEAKRLKALEDENRRLKRIVADPKRVYRLYREEGLQLPKRRRKRLRSVARQPLSSAQAPNARWSMAS